MWRQQLRRIFIVTQLVFAIYYSNDAITTWNNSPIVTSGKYPEIYLGESKSQSFNFS